MAQSRMHQLATHWRAQRVRGAGIAVQLERAFRPSHIDRRMAARIHL